MLVRELGFDVQESSSKCKFRVGKVDVDIMHYTWMTLSATSCPQEDSCVSSGMTFKLMCQNHFQV